MGELTEVLGSKGGENVDLSAAEQGGIDFKRWVFGGGADEGEQTAFDVREEGVLLGFVEAVDFVDKENGALTVLEGKPGFGDGFADVFDAGEDGGNGKELGIEALGKDVGEGGFADAGAAPKEHGVGDTAFESGAQRFAGVDEVLLADHIVEGVWAEAFGEGSGGSLVEEVVHGFRLPEKVTGDYSLIEAAGVGHDSLSRRAGEALMRWERFFQAAFEISGYLKTNMAEYTPTSIEKHT